MSFKKRDKVIIKYCHRAVNLDVLNSVSNKFMQAKFKVLQKQSLNHLWPEVCCTDGMLDVVQRSNSAKSQINVTNWSSFNCKSVLKYHYMEPKLRRMYLKEAY